MNETKQPAVASQPELGVRPLRLRWHARRRPVLGEELFAPVFMPAAIERSVGLVGYTAACDTSGLWFVNWWTGNRGYGIKIEMTEALAKAAAQEHFDMMVRALLEPAADRERSELRERAERAEAERERLAREPVKARDDGMPGNPDERHLRHLLAVRVAMREVAKGVGNGSDK